MTSLATFWDVFGDVLIALWFGFTVIAAISGFWALLSPPSFIRFNQRLSVWVSIEMPGSKQHKSIAVERPFYRYHVITGLVLVVAAIYVLYEVIFNLDAVAIEKALLADSAIINIWIGIFIDAVFGWIYISGVIALVIGALVVIRPSYLKGVEQRMNYWVETEKYGHSLDKKHQLLDEWVCAHPRIFGILSLLGSVIVAWSMFYFDYLG